MPSSNTSSCMPTMTCQAPRSFYWRSRRGYRRPGSGVQLPPRAQIEQQPDRLDYLRNVLRPRFLVSAPHGQWQGLDHHVDLTSDPQLAQLSQVDFKKAAMRAWVMAGSHAN